MTLKEYNEKYHNIDPFALGKSIYTLEPIPDYDTVTDKTDDSPGKKLSDEHKQKLRDNLKKAREARLKLK